MLAAGHSVLPLKFRTFFISSFFSPPNLRGSLADRHQTLLHVRWGPRFIKFGQKVRWPLPPKFGGVQTSKFRRDFAQLRDLIANISGTQQDTVNRKTALHSRTGKLNSVYFGPIGPQTAKNRTGVLTHPTGSHQAGHCHAPTV